MATQWTAYALEDLKQILEFLKLHGTEKARIKEINKAITTKAKWIGQNPGVGSPVENAPNFRVAYTVNFRYGIYYLEVGKNTVVIVAVRHTSQERPTARDLEQAAVMPEPKQQVTISRTNKPDQNKQE